MGDVIIGMLEVQDLDGVWHGVTELQPLTLGSSFKTWWHLKDLGSWLPNEFREFCSKDTAALFDKCNGGACSCHAIVDWDSIERDIDSFDPDDLWHWGILFDFMKAYSDMAGESDGIRLAFWRAI